MIPLASEFDVLEVGRVYMVPCVGSVVVVGTPHTDGDHFNNTTTEHFHCDSRFHDDHDIAACGMRNRTVEMEPRRCLRATPAPYDEGRFGLALMGLHADYGFTTAKCGLCPHKGMPILGGTCTGHRLEWLDDGTIKYKPPYRMVIRGSANCIEITERIVNPDLFVIEITEPIEGCPVIVDMLDRDGTRIASQRFDIGHMDVGDKLKMTGT